MFFLQYSHSQSEYNRGRSVPGKFQTESGGRIRRNAVGGHAGPALEWKIVAKRFWLVNPQRAAISPTVRSVPESSSRAIRSRSSWRYPEKSRPHSVRNRWGKARFAQRNLPDDVPEPDRFHVMGLKMIQRFERSGDPGLGGAAGNRSCADRADRPVRRSPPGSVLLPHSGFQTGGKFFEGVLHLFLVCPAWRTTTGGKFRSRPTGGRLQQQDFGVIREVESEGSPQQSIGPTNRKPI